jgi:hypothetical protein
MRQFWEKLGLIFCPNGRDPLMRSHATLPIAEPVGGDLYRIYYSSRDDRNRSRTFSLIVDLNRPLQPIELVAEPLLDLGELGGFDDSGAMLSWITDAGELGKYFYYAGWNLGVTVPFRNALGVALVKDGRVVQRYRGPVLDRSLTEPHFVGAACILRENGGYRCWYLSCVGWEERAPRPIHRYHIKYATSDNGLWWRRDGIVAIDFADPGEYAIARPSVVRDPDRYRMWFSHRGENYRIGYAESEDGIVWSRMDDQVGLEVSGNGWDSVSLAYPYVFDHKGTRFMLYNGNEYGKSGFGLAVLR